MKNPAQLPKALLLLLLATLLSFSCMHKDVMTGTMDDILATLVYEGPEGKFLIQWESIFQANSKESNGGVTHISGYAERRLSSYDLSTGQLKSRVELGEQIEEANALLGFSPGKIWMYSIEEELGLHYRNPLTLEVEAAWPALSQKSSLSQFRPALPEWSQIPAFYAMDWQTGNLLLTDLSGYRYLLNPADFSLTKTEKEIKREDWEFDPYNSSGQFQKDEYYSLSGNPRRKIEFRGISSPESLSFLEGEFLVDPASMHQAARKAEYLKMLKEQIQGIQDSLNKISAAYPELEEGRHGRNSEYNERYRNKKDLQRQLERLEREAKDMESRHKEVLNSALLSPDGKSAFIRHASTLSDTAHALISKVDFLPDTSWALQWTSYVEAIYFDYSKADQSGAFEKVFSKGNPTFDYAWAGLVDGKLILVEQLRMVGLDAQTGKVLWQSE